MDEQLELLQELTQAPGPSGFEGPVREILRRRLAPLGELSSDRLGSVICRQAGTAHAPKVMVASHMDEIGFVVTGITDEGFLRFQTVGGWWEQVMLAQRVTVLTRQGEIPGIIGAKPPHILNAEERKKVVDKKDMFIDIGVANRAEAEAAGVRPGDPVVPVGPFTVMSNEKYLLSKAWDNRIGCAVMVETLRRLKEQSHPNVVFGVGTVQEEVGLRGAQTSAQAIAPDIAFATDVGVAGDTPGIRPEEAPTKLGKGPAVVYDASMIPHRGLRDFVIETAQQEGIPIQFDAMPGGGTDAGRIHMTHAGVPSVVLAIPTRYIHSHGAVIHRDDFENAVRLVVAVISRLDVTRMAALQP
ncbi:MAG: M42 family metallopeptidase [Limnochordaceae bacterium]|nr:M42 family metallopeptidase [Limnochordaceae bacterium]